MKNPQLELNINNIRAIEEAKIAIDGITVITGENGCGKSTISKLAYHLFKTSIDYDAIIDNKYRTELRNLFWVIDQLSRELVYFLPKEEYNKSRKTFKNIDNLYGLPTLFGPNNAGIIDAIDYLISVFRNIPEKTSIGYQSRLNRIKHILEDTLPGKQKGDITFLLADLKENIKTSYEKTLTIKENRPLTVLYETLDAAFYDSPLKHSFNLSEFGVSILDKPSNRLVPVYSIRNVAYIDTPMALGVTDHSERQHWGDLYNKLQKGGAGHKSVGIDSLFKEIIFKGDVALVEKDFAELIYKREDGKEFNLIECATGLKSFAILQLLYRNGFLDNNTLLIIDEPEVHLHPQWIVEYARLIVLLNKGLGVRFLIASHHPDMISAIRYIAEKEKVSDNLNYYLAEKTVAYLYKYRHLGLDIDDIFASFNIALERIDLYGKTE